MLMMGPKGTVSHISHAWRRKLCGGGGGPFQLGLPGGGVVLAGDLAI